jgi:hypothetical protein
MIGTDVDGEVPGVKDLLRSGALLKIVVRELDPRVRRRHRRLIKLDSQLVPDSNQGCRMTSDTVRVRPGRVLVDPTQLGDKAERQRERASSPSLAASGSSTRKASRNACAFGNLIVGAAEGLMTAVNGGPGATRFRFGAEPDIKRGTEREGGRELRVSSLEFLARRRMMPTGTTRTHLNISRSSRIGYAK